MFSYFFLTLKNPNLVHEQRENIKNSVNYKLSWTLALYGPIRVSVKSHTGFYDCLKLLLCQEGD